MNQDSPVCFKTLEELTEFIDFKLCEQNILKKDVFPMTRKLLRRKSKVCGMTFCLHGPRSVKSMAIWEMETNRILFYDSIGKCFHITQVQQAPTEDFLNRFSDNIGCQT